MAITYYSAPYNPVTVLPRDVQNTATRVDSDAVFHTIIENFLIGLAAEEGLAAPFPEV
jgi:hypothetical protein